MYVCESRQGEGSARECNSKILLHCSNTGIKCFHTFFSYASVNHKYTCMYLFKLAILKKENLKNYSSSHSYFSLCDGRLFKSLWLPYFRIIVLYYAHVQYYRHVQEDGVSSACHDWKIWDGDLHGLVWRTVTIGAVMWWDFSHLVHHKYISKSLNLIGWDESGKLLKKHIVLECKCFST